MTELFVTAERSIDAPAPIVYGYLADFRGHHPKILPPAFSNFTVLEGGVGAGTVSSFDLSLGGRRRSGRMKVAEPEPGRVMTETELDRPLVTTFTVEPEASGSTARVRIETRWTASGGLDGILERIFAPRMLRALYEDELARLDAYARSRPGS
jgi:hypothetical protein